MLTRPAARAFFGATALFVLSAGCGKATIGGAKVAAAETPKAGFSFAVFGDSRSMMQLPYRKDQEVEARS
jgi:hypothetical protein